MFEQLLSENNLFTTRTMDDKKNLINSEIGLIPFDQMESLTAQGRILDYYKNKFLDETKDKLWNDSLSLRDDQLLDACRALTLAYIVGTGLLAKQIDAVIESYNSRINLWNSSAIVVSRDNKDLIKLAIQYRDKIAAHTAFAMPYPDDNEAAKHSSNLIFITRTGDTPRNFILGGVQIMLDGIGPEGRFPEIGYHFINEEKKVKQYFAEKEQDLLESLNLVKSMSPFTTKIPISMQNQVINGSLEVTIS